MKSTKQLYFALLLQEKGMALLGILLAVLTAYSGIALLAVSGWFISAAALAGLSVTAAHAFNFFTPGALVRGLSMSRTAGRYGERLASHEATFRIISRLRADLFRLISRSHWSEQQLNRHETSSRLLQDIQNVEAIYLSALLPAAVSLAVTLAYLLTLQLVLPSLLPWLLPPVLFATLLMPWLYSRRVLQPESTLHQNHSEQWLAASTLLSSIRTLTLFGRLQHSGEQLQQQALLTDQYETQAVKRQQQVLLLTQLSLIAMTLLTFWQGLLAYQQGQLEGAYAFMLLLLTLGTTEVLLSSCPALASLGLGFAALKRLQTIQTSQAHTDSRNFKPNNEADLQLQISNLDYHYPQQQQLFQQFSFQHNGPGWLWLSGSSGAGKSTLLSLLYGRLQPQQGTIEFNGIMHDEVRLMPQRIDILRASLRDNLCLNHNYSETALWQALQLVELEQWAQQLPKGLDTWLGDGEWQPSGGECKRLGLARLILQNPKLILLDEPTAGMDSVLAETIYQRLSKHWSDKLVICSSHDIGFGQDYDHLIELNGIGRRTA